VIEVRKGKKRLQARKGKKKGPRIEGGKKGQGPRPGRRKKGEKAGCDHQIAREMLKETDGGGLKRNGGFPTSIRGGGKKEKVLQTDL